MRDRETPMADEATACGPMTEKGMLAIVSVANIQKVLLRFLTIDKIHCIRMR